MQPKTIIIPLSIILIIGVIRVIILIKRKIYKQKHLSDNLGKLPSLARLKKEVLKLEKQNKMLEKIKKLKENDEQERSSLNSRIKRLKSQRIPLRKLRKKASALAVRSKPLALRLKRALDKASLNQ